MKTRLVGTLALMWLPIATGSVRAQGACEILVVGDDAFGSSLHRVLDVGGNGSGHVLGSFPLAMGHVEGAAGTSAPFYAVRVDTMTGTSHLIKLEYPDDVGSWTVFTSPIGFPYVYGLAVHGEALLGASYDGSTSRSSLIDIDPLTGQGILRGMTVAPLRIVGLASANGMLYGTSRPLSESEAPALFRIDPSTGGEAWLIETPEVLEGLGGGNVNASIPLYGVGKSTYFGDEMGFGVSDIEFESPAPVVLRGASALRCWTPTRTTSWSRLKSGGLRSIRSANEHEATGSR